MRFLVIPGAHGIAGREGNPGRERIVVASLILSLSKDEPLIPSLPRDEA
jgi:hypothetical protein